MQLGAPLKNSTFQNLSAHLIEILHEATARIIRPRKFLPRFIPRVAISLHATLENRFLPFLAQMRGFAIAEFSRCNLQHFLARHTRELLAEINAGIGLFELRGASRAREIFVKIVATGHQDSAAWNSSQDVAALVM